MNRVEVAAGALLLLAATLITFWPATRCAFVNYDDPDYITNNSHVQQGLSAPNIAWAFGTGHAGNYHPLTWLSLMLDRTLWGASPAGFHATNLALHAINGVLLFLILRAAAGSTIRSFFAAALFALHPLRVESVAWATERKDVLAMFFALGAIGAYVRYAARPRWPRYLAIAFLLELALLSKSTAVTLPAIFLLLDFWPLRRVRLDASDANPLKRPLQKLLAEKLPLLGLSLVACTATLIAQSAGGAVGSTEKYPLPARLANAVVSYARYLRKLIWPTDLAVFYPNRQDIATWLAIASLILLIAITIYALRRRTAAPAITVGWLWFLGALVPMIGLVQSGAQAMADRFTYLPMIGLAFAIAWAIPQRWLDTLRGRAAVGAVAAALLVAMSLATRGQIAHWQNSERLFAHALEVTHDNHVAHNNLAFELTRQSRFDEARSHYLAALRINPRYSVAHNGLGSLLAKTGQPAAALDHYAAAVQCNPNYAIAQRNLASQLAAAGRLDEAVAHFRRCVELRPRDVASHTLLAMTLAQTNRLDEALPHFRAAADLDSSDVQAQVNLGHALVELNRPREALHPLKRAMTLDSKSADSHFHAGAALAQLGQPVAAADEYRRALALDPQDRAAQAALDKLTAGRQRSASVAE